MGLGSRASSLVHKCRDLFRGLRAEFGVENRDMTRAEICSLTTDLWTESGIMEVLAHSWKDMLPHWQKPMTSSLDEDVGPVEMDSAPQPLFPSAVTVAGTLHIVNNMSLEADQSLKHWDAYLDQL